MTGSNPDAELVALGQKFEALSAQLAVLQKQEADKLAPVADPGERLNAGALISPSVEHIEAVLRLLAPIEHATMARPAVTVVGLGVKARHAAHVLLHCWTDPPEALDWDARTVRLPIESRCTVAAVTRDAKLGKTFIR